MIDFDTFYMTQVDSDRAERAEWIEAMDEIEHDWTPEPDDFAPDEDADFDSWLDSLDVPEHDDDSNHVIVNYYRGE
jgi:hypothetical protein